MKCTRWLEMREMKVFAKSSNAKDTQTHMRKCILWIIDYSFYVWCACAGIQHMHECVHTGLHARTLNMRLTCCCMTKWKQNLVRYKKKRKANKTPHRFAQNLYTENVRCTCISFIAALWRSVASHSIHRTQDVLDIVIVCILLFIIFACTLAICLFWNFRHLQSASQ